MRLEKGLSQEEMAFQCSCYPSHIGQIERAEGNPSLDTLCRLADGLEVSLSELLDFGKEMDISPDEEICNKIFAYARPLSPYAKKQLLTIVKAFARTVSEERGEAEE